MVSTRPDPANVDAKFRAAIAASRRSPSATSADATRGRAVMSTRRSGTSTCAAAVATRSPAPAISKVRSSPNASARKPPSTSPTGTPIAIAPRTMPLAAPAAPRPAWSASACAATNTQADAGPWRMRPARKKTPGCSVFTPSQYVAITTKSSTSPTSSVRRPPKRSAIIPTMGFVTMRAARFAARITPMNASESPARCPTEGKMGNAMPPATPARRTPGAMAHASRRPSSFIPPRVYPRSRGWTQGRPAERAAT